MIGIKALGEIYGPDIFAAQRKPWAAHGAMQIRLNVQFPDGAVGGDDGFFFGLAVFRRHKAPNRLTRVIATGWTIGVMLARQSPGWR